MKIKIERIEEYELYIRKSLHKSTKDKKKIDALVKVLMEGFNDGIKFNSGRLMVDIDE